ncbi:MAG: sulfotransferase domain-containing protein [Candidatus Pelagibacter sp.]
MPNLLVLTKRGIDYKIKNNFLNIPEKIDCLIISPGGCGSTNLIKYLNKYCKSNLYFEKKYKIFALGHLYKPPPSFFKNKVKIILLKRNINQIYKSMKSRGFIRNALNTYGDMFPFLYINIFKNQKNLKNKFLNNLRVFYSNWNTYPKKQILKINYNDLYTKLSEKKKIFKFLNLNNKNFLNKFPKHKRYKKDKNFVDPSTALMKKIHNL